MQKSQSAGILQTANDERKKDSDAVFRWKTIRRIPSNHKQAERFVIKAVQSGELEIDDKGRVWRIKRRCGIKTGGSHLLPVPRKRAEHKTKTGYLQVRIMRHGKRVHAGASRLVWQFFYGDIPLGYCLNHINGIKDNNEPKNLEIVTYSQNMKHAYQNNLINEHGEKNPAAKLTNEQVFQIRELYAEGKFTQMEMGKMFNVAFQTISVIVRGKSRARQKGRTKDYTYRRNHGNRRRDLKTGRFC